MLNRITLLVLCFFAFQSSYAEIVELDNQDVAHCRSQLAEAKDNFPIVFIGDDDCEYSNAFEPIYQQLAFENFDRAFFKYYVYKNKQTQKWVSTETENRQEFPIVLAECLHVNVDRTPYLLVMVKESDDSIPGLFKSGSPAGATLDQLRLFISPNSL